jgi:hypothetical protein
MVLFCSTTESSAVLNDVDDEVLSLLFSKSYISFMIPYSPIRFFTLTDYPFLLFHFARLELRFLFNVAFSRSNTPHSGSEPAGAMREWRAAARPPPPRSTLPASNPRPRALAGYPWLAIPVRRPRDGVARPAAASPGGPRPEQPLRDAGTSAVDAPRAADIVQHADFWRLISSLSRLTHLIARLPVDGSGVLLLAPPQALEGAMLERALERSRREAQPQPQPPRSVSLRPRAISAAEAREGRECPVCLSAFQHAEPGIVELKCGHLFHRACLEPWFGAHHTCPMCRTDIDEG